MCIPTIICQQSLPRKNFPKNWERIPTAWEISRGIVVADIVFARPADQVQPPSRNGIPQSGYSARTMLGIEAKIDESVSYPGMIKLCSMEEQSYVHHSATCD